jgi:transcriptional regulator with XRE-family HTH domain
MEVMGMNQLITGKFIFQKRKEKNLTQEQLAEKLGVSNKTISKWETGKCMPDYAVVKSLCEELEITVTELMDGEKSVEKSVRAYDEEQIMDLLKRTQELEKQKNILFGIILIVMGIALQAVSHTIGGSNVKDIFSGLLLGLSIAAMLVGVYIAGRGIAVR